MSLDQFYTKSDIAEICWSKVIEYTDIDKCDYIVEPSAGKGAFFSLFPETKRIGMDLVPKYPHVTKMDFFDFKYIVNKKYATVGNPPFGRVSSVAIKFFNKSAEYSDIIAFIIPRTFKRVSVQNKLNMDFHLIYNEDLPLNPCCFEPKMDAKCCFQIWIRKEIKRVKVVYDKSHPDFSFMKHGPKDKKNQPTPPVYSDFAMKAYGSNCGEIIDSNLQSLRPKSWHWIKSNISINLLKDRFASLDYSISKDTVRQDSIGQKELIFLYSSKYN
jgi:hypothetical protein